MFKRICKITFISHGATVYSQEGIINDNIKSPKLNDLGECEIEKICGILKERGVLYDKIYSSPNACCTQTAQLIAKIFKQKTITIDLKNRNHGVWNGMTFADLYKEFGTKFFSKTPENGEEIETFNKRVAGTINELVEKNKGNRIIVVTTPEIIQSAIANTLELTPSNQYKILIKTGSMTQISYFKDWSSIIYADCFPL